MQSTDVSREECQQECGAGESTARRAVRPPAPPAISGQPGEWSVKGTSAMGERGRLTICRENRRRALASLRASHRPHGERAQQRSVSPARTSSCKSFSGRPESGNARPSSPARSNGSFTANGQHRSRIKTDICVTHLTVHPWSPDATVPGEWDTAEVLSGFLELVARVMSGR